MNRDNRSYQLISMIAYCPPQRHLVDGRSKEDISDCWSINNIIKKVVLLINLFNLLS